MSEEYILESLKIIIKNNCKISYKILQNCLSARTIKDIEEILKKHHQEYRNFLSLITPRNKDDSYIILKLINYSLVSCLDLNNEW